ncbi:hypothetical protein [Spongiactinospora sp. TRM90649]|uniref:hypothetical protein n=1 Tax=Spongiactinospora sp. TRM90649 TaxID=3031114 RepID=UPI0023F89DA4|nr:hypothetical protein [Spongiactinospora sp. TRM90649]MDF5758624.1 hypothetical protein [Spongiactinospora sp. TRM90649]
MTFPSSVLPVVVELQLGTTWTDITPDVYRRVLIEVTRGQSSEGSQVDPSTARVTIDNTSGNYSPRYPSSPAYALLGRNTPIRIAIEQGATYLELPGAAGDRATTPDNAAVSITGDIDIRIDATFGSWRAATDLAGKYLTTGDQRSWVLSIDDAGYVELAWSTTGALAGILSRTSTWPVPAPGSGRQAVRATLDVNNGSGGHTVAFYTGPSVAGPWTQLGISVVTAGTTSIFDSSAAVEVGDLVGRDTAGIAGRVHAFELRAGIGGSAVANPDFTLPSPGVSSFADAAGRTWSVAGGARLSNRRYRFAGEVSSWPVRSDKAGLDVYLPLEAGGILRRLSQGASALGSAMYRGRLYDAASLVAYWPFEDAEGATSIAPALDHGPMQIIGTPTLASFEGFVASAPLPVLAGAEMRGQAPAYTDSGQTQVRWLMAVPAAGAEAGQTMMMWYTTGSVRRWEVHYDTGGTLGLRAFDGDGNTLFDSGDVAFGVNGRLVMCSVELTQSGSNINWNLLTLEPAATSGLSFSGTLNNNTVGRVGTVVVSPGGGVATTTIGHVSVQAVVTTLFDLGPQLSGWLGETSGRRIARLCREEGIAFQARGDLDDTTRLGVQGRSDLLTLIREAAEADAGRLFEPRDTVGLGYRTRASMYNQVAALAVPYAALGEPLDPLDDDRLTKNDITASRDGGSSARAALEDGPLSVQPPPDGVGRYEETVSLSVRHDLDLFDQAAWRLALGTVDEARYPQIGINYTVNAFAFNAALTTAALDLEAGDRLAVDDLPAWLPPETISQIVLGVAESFGGKHHTASINCSPARPYQVGVYGTSRYGPSSTVTNEVLDATETGVDITTPTGPLWDTSASGFDIVIGGERMTVTAVGAPSGVNQTLTVTRSVNGVVKAHATGAQVSLAEPAVYAL